MDRSRNLHKMASVSSLDKDLARLRQAKYTAKDSSEMKEWISDVLETTLPDSKDLMECLKDGVLLCRLTNLLPGTPTLKPKNSTMPFVQMEQIAAFLNIVSKPPVSLPPHDLFLTVDLFEQKDPAQVVQCLTSFSRIANRLSPEKFPCMVGGRRAPMSPPLGAAFKSSNDDVSAGRRDFNSGSSGTSGYSANSSISTTSSIASVATPMFPPTSPPRTISSSVYKKPLAPVVPSKPAGNVSSWSKKGDEKKSVPAWNIHQYGYMGGASQGKMGVSFGARRQIVNHTPVKAPAVRRQEEEERRKKEEEERKQASELLQRSKPDFQRRKMEEDTRKEEERKHKEEVERKQKEDAERERANLLKRREEEDKRREEAEKRKMEEAERERVNSDYLRRKMEDDRRRQEEKRLEEKRREEELRWKRLEEEEAKERAKQTARHSESLIEAERRRVWQEEQDKRREREFAEQKLQRDEAAQRKLDREKAQREIERQRVRELERELELARERERRYLAERQERQERELQQLQQQARPLSPPPPPPPPHQTPFSSSTDHRFLRSTKSSGALLPPAQLKSHKTGGFSPVSPSGQGFAGKITTHRTGGPTIGGGGGLIPQRTGGLVAQLTGEFNRLPAPSLKTLTPGEYASAGRISPRPVTPNRTTAPAESPFAPKSGGFGAQFKPTPRALPSPPTKKTQMVPRELPSPPSAPASKFFTDLQPSDLQRSTSTSTQNSWEHDNETVIDVPTAGAGMFDAERQKERERELEKQKTYKWANMSFLEKERERERVRQKEWERGQMESPKTGLFTAGMKQGGGGLMGPRGMR